MALLQGHKLRITALLHGHELGSPRLCCGADAVQHAEAREPLEKRGAHDLGHGHLGMRQLLGLLVRALVGPVRAVWFHHESDASVSAEHGACGKAEGARNLVGADGYAVTRACRRREGSIRGWRCMEPGQGLTVPLLRDRGQCDTLVHLWDAETCLRLHEDTKGD
eukprot:scaffold9171_cov78-Phaeocystis_antarctica.AAC.1